MLANVPLHALCTTAPEHHSNSENSSGEEGDEMSSACVLANLEIFKGCSHEYLTWIQEHLETIVCFPDEVIAREGSHDESSECMYIICHGMVILEGTGTQQSQVSLGRGTTFGEQQLLEVVEQPTSTATAVEITMLQVLHRRIMRLSLEKFPDHVPVFDRVALKWLDQPGRDDFSNMPVFSGCSTEFCSLVKRTLVKRLVHRGKVIIEDGQQTEKLFLLRTGTVVHETFGAEKNDALTVRTLPERAAINMDTILGINRGKGSTFRAVKMCVIGEIDASIFIQILQRHPKAIMQLMYTVAGRSISETPTVVADAESTRLWPFEVDSVPLFRGVSHSFFDQLMDMSEWQMFPPDQNVVKQGGHGNFLYLLCYGSAVIKVDGIVIGAPLAPGDYVGGMNFLGMSTKYRACLRTRTVCHLRVFKSTHLTELLVVHSDQKERFESLKHEVRREAAEQDARRAEQLARERLRRRISGAFQRHVRDLRDVRGLDPDAGNPFAAAVQDAARTNTTASKPGTNTLRRTQSELTRTGSKQGSTLTKNWATMSWPGASAGSKEPVDRPRDSKETETLLRSITKSASRKVSRAASPEMDSPRSHGSIDSPRSMASMDSPRSMESKSSPRLPIRRKPRQKRKSGDSARGSESGGSRGASRRQSRIERKASTQFGALSLDGLSKSLRKKKKYSSAMASTFNKGLAEERGKKKRNRSCKEPNTPFNFGFAKNQKSPWGSARGSAGNSPREAKGVQDDSADGSESSESSDSITKSSSDEETPEWSAPATFRVTVHHAHGIGDLNDAHLEVEFEKPLTKLDVINSSIIEFAETRKMAAVRGRVLRLYRNGLSLDLEHRGVPPMTAADWELLDRQLPQLKLPAARPQQLPSTRPSRDLGPPSIESIKQAEEQIAAKFKQLMKPGLPRNGICLSARF